MAEIMNKISAPSVTKDATEKLLRKMYISNVAKRLRELNAPSDVDRKRWVWELIQNAKDTIVGDPTRQEINVRIEIEGDTVKFRHDGNPFTADARFGLLYKYSEDKENQESTGRFGTGFLTTHCLSKVVTIESNMYSNDERTKQCGFSVTMYRDGQIEKELLEGLDKMQASEEYYQETFDWTTFTYHVSTESGRRAIRLGIENFHDNIAQTMLFCKELASIELNDNGKVTSIVRKPIVELGSGVKLAEFEINGETTNVRRFLFASSSEHNDQLSVRYRAERSIRIDAAVEIDENNNILDHGGKTSHYCVLPLVGIESQLDEPIIVNSPDFEPDSERQSLLLVGQDWNDETNNITETGINKLIYEKIFPLYESLVEYVSSNQYGHLYLLANGLKKAKEHDKLDAKWYTDNVIKKYREILLKYPVVEPYSGTNNMLLTDCIVVKEAKVENENAVFILISQLYPSKLVKNNHEWAQYVWKEGLNSWNTEDLCKDVANKSNWNNISVINETTLTEWYNKFLGHVYTYNELYLKEHALLPNMNGELLKKDATDFKQGEHVTSFIIELLNKMGKDVKPILLHHDITSVSLESKYTSQSFSADLNKLAKSIIDNGSVVSKLDHLLPLLSVIPSDIEKYGANFIEQRQRFFDIAKSLFVLPNAISTTDNSLLDGSWKELDIWFVTHVLNCLKSKGALSELPNGLGAKWLNDALQSLKVEVNRLNIYEVLPNQYGKFCKQNTLFEDINIPEELKDDVFGDISLKYKDLLLHSEIDAAAFSVTQKKTISDFARDLKNKVEPTTSSSWGNYFNGSYHRYSQNAIEKVSLYVLSLLPQNKDLDLYMWQEKLLNTSRELLAGTEIPASSYINYESKDLWQDINFIIVSLLSNKIKSAETIEVLTNNLNNCGEIHLFELLNSFYDFLKQANISYTAPKIFPNQEGIFCTIGELKKEEGTIDDILKNIISRIVSENEDYRHLLMDKRCSIQPQSELTLDSAYALIDEKMHELYENPNKWVEQNFIEAAQMLIEDWGDKHKGTFEDKFPRTFPDKEKILMNVVWKKEKRELMMTVSNKLTEDQLRLVIENSAQIGELTSKVKELEDENEVLRSQLAAMGICNEPKVEDIEADDYNVDNLSDIIVPVEMDTVTSDGQHHTITVAEPQYAGLSAEEMREYLIQAKTDVMLYLKDKGYTFTKGICEDAWCNIYGVFDPQGHEVPIVVHSYKSRRRAFSLNTSDWEELAKDKSMLWVVTHDGPQCVPFYALPRDTNTIAITFSPENMQYKNRCIALAETLRYFKGLHFNFGTAIGNNKTPEPFNNPSEEMKLAMRDLHDLPAQSGNLPQVGANEQSIL
ncbi:sacsin N-terminal ATP-binding-like domain-containing protein [Prevotella sp. P5-50]|uniref:sacsin N-terminal ATP-binding-like domain-containing protein n=1 Tax=Prevotella sp. P5-50 TaxID=2024217 RepID=UPI000B975542|nr:hypothetical protein [Prevotella sp. P5-50]OYP41924.1 hypothetical protein CIK88_03550 [Prevotella sp. P5-50]